MGLANLPLAGYFAPPRMEEGLPYFTMAGLIVALSYLLLRRGFSLRSEGEV
jgi:hypothetical protein